MAERAACGGSVTPGVSDDRLSSLPVIENECLKSHPRAGVRSLASHDHAVAAGAGGNVLLLGIGAGRGVESTSGATAVELDPLTPAGDSVALAGARAAVGSGGAVARERRGRRGAVRAVGEAGRGWGRAAEVGNELIVVDASRAEAGSELLHGLLIVVLGIKDASGGVGSDGLGRLDLRDRERAALGGVAVTRRSVAPGGRGGGRLVRALAGGLAGGLGRPGDVEDVQGPASGGLDGGVLTGVVGDVVAIDNVVVPVSLASLDCGVLEPESSLPGAGLGGRLVLGKGELAGVVVPRTEKVDGLDTRRDTERERKLNSRHYCCC